MSGGMLACLCLSGSVKQKSVNKTLTSSRVTGAGAQTSKSYDPVKAE